MSTEIVNISINKKDFKNLKKSLYTIKSLNSFKSLHNLSQNLNKIVSIYNFMYHVIKDNIVKVENKGNEGTYTVEYSPINYTQTFDVSIKGSDVSIKKTTMSLSNEPPQAPLLPKNSKNLFCREFKKPKYSFEMLWFGHNIDDQIFVSEKKMLKDINDNSNYVRVFYKNILNIVEKNKNIKDLSSNLSEDSRIPQGSSIISMIPKNVDSINYYEFSDEDLSENYFENNIDEYDF